VGRRIETHGSAAKKRIFGFKGQDGPKWSTWDKRKMVIENPTFRPVVKGRHGSYLDYQSAKQLPVF